MMLSKSAEGAALTQVTEAAQHVTIAIPAGKGGTLKAVAFQVNPTLDTVVDSGGLVRLYNTSADWDPFYFLTANHSVVTEGGEGCAQPVMYAVEKELPGNSTVYANFTPYDNQSQYLEVTLIWELGKKPGKETFSGYIHPLKAAAVSATARASPGNYAVPGGKGGRIYCLYHLNWPTIETVVDSGGLVELENNAYDMTPCHWYTGYGSTVGASGGGVMYPDKIPWDGPCPQNSTFYSYFTPDDDQSQTLSTLILWERPIRRTVA